AAARLQGDLGGGGAEADAAPPLVGRHVEPPVGDRLAGALAGEVVDEPPLRLAPAPPLAAAVGEVAQQLLLLGVDRHGRLAVALELAQPRGDELELGVAVRVLAALAR